MLLLTAFVNPVSVLSFIQLKPRILFNFEIIASIPALKHLSFFITFLLAIGNHQWKMIAMIPPKQASSAAPERHYHKKRLERKSRTL